MPHADIPEDFKKNPLSKELSRECLLGGALRCHAWSFTIVLTWLTAPTSALLDSKVSEGVTAFPPNTLQLVGGNFNPPLEMVTVNSHLCPKPRSTKSCEVHLRSLCSQIHMQILQKKKIRKRKKKADLPKCKLTQYPDI